MKRGLLAIAGVGALTVLAWALSHPVTDVALGVRVAQLIAALALVGFATSNAISTRYRVIDGLFNGLDKAYLVHKWVGLSSMGLVVVHIVTVGVTRTGPTGRATWAAHFGAPSLTLFVVLGLVALFARRVKYEVWQTVHKFMLLPYVIGLVHYYGASTYDPFRLSPFSLWLDVVNVVGVACAVYSLVFYPRFAFPFRYVVSAVRAVAPGSVEITGQPTGRGLRYRPGQFTFVRFGKQPAHPYTIGAGPSNGTLQFTIKAAGDHTRALVETAAVGDTFVVSTAHGRFDYTRGGRRQVWIAGGSGLTPFRSFYLAGVPDAYDIDLFYAYHGDAGVYLDELAALARPNVRVHLVDDTVQGYLTPAMVAAVLPPGTPVDVYFCGPEPLRDLLRQGLPAAGVTVAGFHMERFRFAR